MKLKRKKGLWILLSTFVLIILIAIFFFIRKSRIDDYKIGSAYSAIKLGYTDEKINNDSSSIEDVYLIIGSWQLDNQWSFFDDIDKWGAIKIIDVDKKFEFSETGIFRYKELSNQNKIDSSLQGEFYIDKLKKKLSLYFNESRDSIIDVGEKVKALDKKIFLLNDSILRIEANFYTTSLEHFNILEYKKIKE